MTGKREAKRAAKAWDRAERDALEGKADAAWVATIRPAEQEKRTEEGGSKG